MKSCLLNVGEVFQQHVSCEVEELKHRVVLLMVALVELEDFFLVSADDDRCEQLKKHESEEDVEDDEVGSCEGPATPKVRMRGARKQKRCHII